MNTQQDKTAGATIGQRIALARAVERFPDFIAPLGAQGVIDAVTSYNVSVKMDEPIKGCEPWNNCILWNGEELESFRHDVHFIVPQLATVRCAGDGTFLHSFRPNGAGIFGHNFDRALWLPENDKRLVDLVSTGVYEKVFGAPIQKGGTIIEKPIRVYIRKEDGCGFFFMNYTLYSAPACANETLEMENALPVVEWESEPLDEDGWTEVCAALGKPVPAIQFRASIRFSDGTLKTLEGKGNEHVEGNAVDLINAFTHLPTTSAFDAGQRASLVAAVIHALGTLLFAQPDATHRQMVNGTSLFITQARG